MKTEQPQIFIEDIVEVRNPFSGECIGKDLVVKHNPHSDTGTSPLWVFLDVANERLISTGAEVIVIKSLKERSG